MIVKCLLFSKPFSNFCTAKKFFIIFSAYHQVTQNTGFLNVERQEGKCFPQYQYLQFQTMQELLNIWDLLVTYHEIDVYFRESLKNGMV